MLDDLALGLPPSSKRNRSTRTLAIRPSHATCPPIRSNAISGPQLHEGERHVEDLFERVDRHRLVRLVVALRAVGQVDDGEPGGNQRVGVAAPAGGDVHGLDPAGIERRRSRLDRGRGAG